MKLLQNGFPRSGDYWLYTIIEKIYQEAQVSRDSFIKKHPIYKLAKTWPLSFPRQADVDMIDILYVGTFYRISSVFKKKIFDV